MKYNGVLSGLLLSGLLAGMLGFAQAPAVAQEGGAVSVDDMALLFGQNPGAEKMFACFRRSYSKEHLASHPDQNVTDMLLLVSKPEGVEDQYELNLQASFRQLDKPYNVSGGCSKSKDKGRLLNCGIDCDGGSLYVKVKNQSQMLLEIPERVRMWDPSQSDADQEEKPLPEKARFGSDDKLFKLDRTSLKDCMPLVYNDEEKVLLNK